MSSELKEFLLNEYSDLTARREELVEELNIIEGQLT